MAVFMILDAAKTTTEKALNTKWARVEPRAVDAASPGSVTDQNSTVVPLTGKILIPIAVFNDPMYANMKASLTGISYADITPSTVFLPSSVT